MTIKYLYKYFDKKEYAHAMVRNGTVKIGTSAEYRAMEKEDAARGDKYEGAVRLDYTVDDSGALPEDHYDYLARRGISIIGAPGFKLDNYKAIGPEFYMYCSSYELSASIARMFNAQACVRIAKPYFVVEKIFSALARRKLIKGPEYLSAKVVYYGIPFDIDQFQEFPSCILKRDIFSGQREYRFGYFSLTNDPKPQIIDVPELRSFCKIIDLPG